MCTNNALNPLIASLTLKVLNSSRLKGFNFCGQLESSIVFLRSQERLFDARNASKEMIIVSVNQTKMISVSKLSGEGRVEI